MSRITFIIFFLVYMAPTFLYAGVGRADLEKGITELRKGDYKGCIRSFSSYLESTQNSKDKKGQAEAQYWLSRCYFELRRYDDSLKYAEKSRALYESTDDKGGLLSANALLIEVLVEKKNNREAHRIVDLSKKMMDGGCPKEATIDFLLARGRFFIDGDEPELSSQNYQAALEEARKVGDPAREVRAFIGLTLVNLYARSFFPRKDFIKARETAYAAQRLAFENNVGPYLQAQSLQICTRMELNDNKNEEALKNALSAKAIYKLTGNRLREADVLSTASYVYYLLKETQKAIACNDEAIDIYRTEGDTLKLISEYRGISFKLDKNDPQASARYSDIIAILKEIADKDGDYRCRIEALQGIVNMLGSGPSSGKQRPEIEEYRDRMVKIAHDAGDKREELKALFEKADHLYSNPREALELYQRTFSLYKSMVSPDKHDPWLNRFYGEGTFYEKMAKALSEMGETKKSMDYYRKAAECNLADGKTVYAAENYISLMNCGIGNYDIDTSLDAFDKAVSAIIKHEDDSWRSQCFSQLMQPLYVMELWKKSMGGEKLSLRESLSMLLIEKIMKNKALVARMDSAYDEMLERRRGRKGLNEAFARSNYAKWAILKKDYRRAQEEYELALSLEKKEVDNEHEWDYESYYLAILADLYLLSGKYDKAVEYEKNAIEIVERSKKDELRLCSELEHLARILKKAGKNEESEKYHKLALQKKKEAYKSTSNLGKARDLWNDNRDSQGALNLYQKALLEEQKLGRKSMEAMILNEMGQIHDETGDLTKGIENYRDTIGIYRDQGDLYRLCDVSLRCGKALEKQNLDKEALTVYLDVLDRIISQWTRHDSVISQLRLSADSSVLSLFDRAIRLLMKSGKSEEALRYLELSHSLELLDGLKLDGMNLKNSELQALLSRFTTLRRRMTLVEGELSQASGEQRKATLKEILSSTRQEFFTTINSIKSKNPDMEQFLSVRSTDLAAMQHMLPKDVLLVEYYPSGDMLYIFGITSDSFITRKVSVPREQLYEAVKAFREKISNPNGGAIGEEKKFLYSKLLEPLEEEMGKKAKLVIVPGGLLWYLPFEALGPSDDSYVITSRPLSYMSSANVLTMISNKAAGSQGKDRMLAFGAPPEANLPGAENELKSIASLYQGTVMCTGGIATKENLFRNAGEKSIVHIASHSTLDTIDINKSFIELAGNDKKLYLGEIYGLLLDPSCLVALSSCQSAMGEDNPGREFASLASAFTTAGSSTVIASQWRVDDEATAKLFIGFYGNLKKNEARSEALREAKLSLLKNRETSHPYYWAPFVLLGDWR
ncbi:MAG: CHAT domain-containing protein [Vulcanimicrobiota bacterium]